jgi:hypothetical protein
VLPKLFRRAAPHIQHHRRILFAIALTSVFGLVFLAIGVSTQFLNKARTFTLIFSLCMFAGMEASGLLFLAGWFGERASVAPKNDLLARLLSAWQVVSEWHASLFLVLWCGVGFALLLLAAQTILV